MKKDLTLYKEKLEQEKALLIKELQGIGVVKSPKNPDDWQATPADIDVLRADKNEVGDFIESYEGNNALVQNLEGQLAEIDSALEAIKNNTFGICTVCKKEIEEDRLEANPAAKTCKVHLNS